ncbi:FixH family protein [Mucilaginibacter lutimaris]|uniref:FixH family protein n=1 Tax=Mucilaginibacter lutimaris TaxID=931629 RepID=A0ABW2ZDT2_9SPHI
MNWGKGLVIGMLLFMSFIISMSFYMFKMPADDYDHQYYEKGLNYNTDYAKEKQVITDKARPIIKQLDGEISIAFKQPATGTIKLITPLGKSKDLIFALNTGQQNYATIPVNKLSTGRWAIRIDWNSGNIGYLYQQDLYINGK